MTCLYYFMQVPTVSRSCQYQSKWKSNIVLFGEWKYISYFLDVNFRCTHNLHGFCAFEICCLQNAKYRCRRKLVLPVLQVAMLSCIKVASSLGAVFALQGHMHRYLAPSASVCLVPLGFTAPWLAVAHLICARLVVKVLTILSRAKARALCVLLAKCV
jgi:hypothetical protein